MNNASTRSGYAPDTFTESEVLRCLDSANLKHMDRGRYILAQCPTHDDAHPSVQIYKDDWFVNCHAGCGRYHITKAFPELREGNTRSYTPPARKRSVQVIYKDFDLIPEWEKMPLIPRDHYFKNIPLEVLDELGWRFVPEYNQYFIPYFSASRQSIPFAQYRNLDPDKPRFIFLKDAKPTCYGTWNLDNSKLFIVEGASDAAVLEHCAIPWIAVPSASSAELVRLLAGYCKQNGISLVYAGDNDSAGSKLRQALDESTRYRVRQPRAAYKDWGEMYEAEGVDSVSDYCLAELAPEVLDRAEVLDNVLDIFPDATELNIVGGGSSKELAPPPQTLF